MANKTKATIQGAGIRASIAVVNVQAGVVVQIPVANIAWVTLHLDAFLDVKGLHFNLQDYFSIEDAVAMAINKPMSDGVLTSDVFTRNVSYARQLQDIVLVLDAASRTVVFVRALADSAVMLDSMSRGLGKAASDAVVVSDAGLILMQSYAVDYFASDYVGLSATF